MRRPRLTRSVTTKVTEDDHALLVEAAGDDTLSDWLRDVAMREARLPPTNALEALMAEVLALRRILLNLHGKTLDDRDMAELIGVADSAKMAQARARLQEPS